MDATTNRIYVLNSLSGSLSVIDGGTNQVVAAAEVRSGPRAVAVNAKTKRIYVANKLSNTLSVAQ